MCIARVGAEKSIDEVNMIFQTSDVKTDLINNNGGLLKDKMLPNGETNSEWKKMTEPDALCTRRSKCAIRNLKNQKVYPHETCRY